MAKSAHRRVGRWLTALALAALVFNAASSGAAPRDPRVVRVPAVVDADGNRLSDFLEAKLADHTFKTVGPPALGIADLIVAFEHPPGPGDVERVTAAGGQVLRAWTDLVYAMRVAFPAARIPALLGLPGVVLVEENAPVAATLYFSTRQTRARQVWAGPYGLEGDGSRNIAVVDTGLDDSHPDTASRVIGWRDEVGPSAGSRQVGYYATPTDIDGHGSHVAGIAAGLAGVQIELAGGLMEVAAGELAQAGGWRVYSHRLRGRLRVIAYSPSATGLTAESGALLSMTNVRGRPRLTSVLLADEAGLEMPSR